jgi:hypothetical protein
MNALIAVVVAFLANGDMNYAAVNAADETDCRQEVAQIEHERLDLNEEEEVKVVGFASECVGFENNFGITHPSESATTKPKHIWGGAEA